MFLPRQAEAELTVHKRTYEGLNVKIQPLEIDESNLNTKRMLDLMAVNQDDGAMPLYLHKITQILKSLRLIQQRTDGPFNYVAFKQEVENSDMTPFQKTPLSQRLDSLESFMPKWQTDIKLRNKGRKGKVGGTDWTVKVREFHFLSANYNSNTVYSPGNLR